MPAQRTKPSTRCASFLSAAKRYRAKQKQSPKVQQGSHLTPACFSLHCRSKASQLSLSRTPVLIIKVGRTLGRRRRGIGGGFEWLLVRGPLIVLSRVSKIDVAGPRIGGIKERDQCVRSGNKKLPSTSNAFLAVETRRGETMAAESWRSVDFDCVEVQCYRTFGPIRSFCIILEARSMKDKPDTTH